MNDSKGEDARDLEGVMSSSMKIWLVRHGETMVGRDGLYKPHHGLTDIGIKQAYEVAKVLAEHEIDACYSSELPRAVETMDRYSLVSGLFGDRIGELNEIDVGGIDEASPEVKRQIIEHKSDLDFSQFGGENPESFYRRVTRGWEMLLLDAERKNAGLVAAFLHGGTIGAIIDFVEGRDFDYRFRPRMPNCSYAVIELDASGTWSPWSGWETSHLSALT